MIADASSVLPTRRSSFSPQRLTRAAFVQLPTLSQGGTKGQRFTVWLWWDSQAVPYHAAAMKMDTRAHYKPAAICFRKPPMPKS